MGFFDFLRKQKPKTTRNAIAGPTHLDGLTEIISDPRDLQPHEWRRMLRSNTGNKKFRIKYYGCLHEKYPTLIVATEFAPALVVAVDTHTGEEIVLFDGCRHGYNAIFCDSYTAEQIDNRPATDLYRAPDGSDTFELTILIYNGIDFDEEFADQVDDDGQIEVADGKRIDYATVKRNAFDSLQISGRTDRGEVIEIISEELA